MFRIASLVEGRISRKTFWLRFGGLWLAALVIFAIPVIAGQVSGVEAPAVNFSDLASAPPPGPGTMLFHLLGLALILASVTVIPIPRFHDRDKSGWRVLLILLPYIGFLWVIGECGLMPGTNEENEYGLPPED
jgi:uncharacterized membrane protein YhaH (DUF805 family)